MLVANELRGGKSSFGVRSKTEIRSVRVPVVFNSDPASLFKSFNRSIRLVKLNYSKKLFLIELHFDLYSDFPFFFNCVPFKPVVLLRISPIAH